MNEEIKEILRFLSHSDWYKEADQLENYITNLQQLYENALKVNQNENKYRTELESKYVLLQQTLHNITINGVEEENTAVLDLINENKKLKECYCNRTDCTGRIKDSKKYDSVYQEKEDYKSRCEKANEWIHKHQQTMENMRKEKFYTLNLGVDDLKELNNILNGSEK